MEYRVTLRSNRRLLILYAIIAALPVIAVLALLFWSRVVGIIALAVVGYIDYQLIKFLRLQLNSYVVTTEDGIRGLSGVSEKVDISWDEVTHAGVGSQGDTLNAAFVYAEGQDQLITVPSDYENFENFVAELEGRFDLIRFQLDENETVADKLKELVLEDDSE